MNRYLPISLLAWIGAAMAEPAWSQTSYPMITHAQPVAVQRGKTVEIVIEGQQNFFGADRILFEGSGVSAEVIPAATAAKAEGSQRPNVRSVRAKVAAAADALPGIREFRVTSSLGVSSVGQLLIVDDPVTVETGDNNTRDKAMALELPCVVSGRLEALEDVDFFRFKAAAGQVVTLEIYAARIEDKIHDLQKHADPMIVLFDSSGKELAASDDFRFADPWLRYRFEKEGEYYLQVRDSKYDGDARWVYALIATTRPHVAHVFPLALRAGEAAEVELIGMEGARARLAAPPDLTPSIHMIRANWNGQDTNPVAVVITPHATVSEQEFNDAPDQATRISLPCCINGRIGRARDHDHFVFAAKRGQALRFEVKARRFGTELISGLDSTLDVLDLKGRVLASGDDISPSIKDAAVVFTPPADGDYVLRIRDLLNKGGEHFVYAIEAEPAVPDFTLRCDGDKAMIGPGSAASWYVHVNRLNGFTGPVAVEVRGLPEGVTASPLVIPPGMNQGLVVLSASPMAPRGAANVQVLGMAQVTGPDGKERTLRRISTPNQEIYLPGGGRGRFDVALHTVAVTDRSDIEAVEVEPRTITLKPGEQVKLAVKVRRRADFTGDVQLDVRLRHLGQVYGDPLPPGVTLIEGQSKTLLGKGNEGYLTLQAAANAAAVEKVPISVLAQVSINFVVKVSHSSEPIPLTVAPAAK